MVQSISPLKITECKKCKGFGFWLKDPKGQHRIKCGACGGVGIAALENGRFLFWASPVTDLTILINKIRQGMRTGIDAFLFLFGLFGLSLFFIETLPEIVEEGGYMLLTFSFWFQRISFFRLIFWLSVVLDLYAFYRLTQESTFRNKLPLRKGHFNTVLLQKDFKEIMKSKNPDVLEISTYLNEEAYSIVERAYEFAKKLNHFNVKSIHLLAALLTSPAVGLVFWRLGISSKVIVQKITHLLALEEEKKTFSEIFLDQDFKLVLLAAFKESLLAKRDKITPQELLVGLLYTPSKTKYIFEDLKLDINKVRNAAIWINFQEDLRKRLSRFRARARYKPKSHMNRALTARPTPLLDALSQDLTLLAKQGTLISLIDREKEFKEMLRGLEQERTNVLIVGDAGVGKTALLGGLAQYMAEEEVPSFLQDKRLVSLNAASLISGVSIGEAEGRLQEALKEVILAGNIVLVIEDIANLVGATTVSQGGALDLTDVLANILDRANIPILATSTRSDFVRYLQKNEAFLRRFEIIDIPELDRESAIQVLEGRALFLEGRHKIYFTYEALEKAVDLAKRFIHDNHLPASAVKLLEEAAVLVKETKGEKSQVTGEDIAKILSSKINVPVAEITTKESEKLLRLEEEIHKRIIDQEEAVKAVASALKRGRTELRDINRPIANLLFLGPTGVGKTELAKTVAQVYFGDENKMTRLDMSEYQDKTSIYRLIGAPPGLSGYQEGGYLTEAVRHNPFTLLLLDEFEKAHPDILNIFLQVMEDGRLTDGLGHTVDFSNVILIATSNAGTGFIQDSLKANISLETIKKQMVDKILKGYFRPELLNRFDAIVIFKPLGMKEVIEIARLMLKKVAARLEKKGIKFRASEEAIKELAQEGFDPALGARPLRRVIQDKVDNALANLLLKKSINRRDVVILEKGGKIKVEKALPL